MKAINPDLKKFIEASNKPLLDEIKRNKDSVTSQYLDIENKFDELRFIKGINGDKKLVKDVVRDTHKDLKIVCKKIDEIKDNTRFLTRSKIFIYVIIFIITQIFVFGVWKGTVDTKFDNVKEIMTDIKKDAYTNQQDIKDLLKEK